MDESFSMPGGGFVNLDFFERVSTAPGFSLVTLLGEGSFHQMHGGTTTNIAELNDRSDLLRRYEEHYAGLRGRYYHGPEVDMKYVGSLPDGAMRTKARRMGAPEYFKLAHVVGTDGKPAKPIPMPEELRTEFVDSAWRSDEWKETTWLGRWMARRPTDLFTYQELLVRAKPDWIIETGTGGGGRASFLASICDLIGHGEILSIDDTEVPRLVEHPRITYLRQDPFEAATAAAAREVVGSNPRGLLIFGASKFDNLMQAYENYSPLVRVDGYLVLEDTILNGHPVWTGFGPGPHEAAKRITDRGDFVRDARIERFAFSFNRGGFLRRVR